MSEAGSWSNTPLCIRWWAGHSSSLCSGGGRERKLSVIQGTDVKVGSLVTKEARSTVLHHPFAMLSWWRCSHLKIGTVTSWG